MKPDNRTQKRKLGDIGENIACDFLKRKGFEIIERNYLRKWGEIDIVTRKKGIIHFVEVKSVSHVTSRLSSRQADYRPEDNMHPWKLKRLSRAMQTYLLDKNLDDTHANGGASWQLDLVTVRIDETNRKARVELIENIII